MKTLTVTIISYSNYGALLQAYGLQKTLCETGCENVIVDYRPPVKKTKKNLKTILRYLYTLLLRIKYKNQVKRREKSFKDFYSNRMNVSKLFTDFKQIEESFSDTEIMITGSDQVWRVVDNKDMMRLRFLNFGSEKAKRLSYAASMESVAVSDENKKFMAESIGRFDAVSVRENYVKDFVSTLTEKNIRRVLDPVFLPSVEDWKKIAAAPKIKEKYILCYQVQSNSRMQDTIDTLKKKTGYKTVAVLPEAMKWINADVSLYDVSPEEFLGLFANAQIVVSASFHGAAFGLIFGKATYGLAKKNGGNRIKEIMNLFGLEKFCITENSEIPAPEDFSASDYSEILKKEREQSINFLKENI